MKSDRRLWVLGGDSGIGEAVWDLVSEEDGWRMSARFGYLDFDARNERELYERIRSDLPTDVVFSVGVNRLDWMRNVRLSDFRTIMDTNVWSFVNLISCLDRAGVESANIVAITSDAAWRPMRTSSVYCASKAALEMAVRVASREYASKGWRINGVAPGKVEDTPMTEYVDRRVLELRGWSEEQAEAYEISSNPMGRKVHKTEVAEVVRSVLLGPPAMTGEIIAVNGGR